MQASSHSFSSSSSDPPDELPTAVSGQRLDPGATTQRTRFFLLALDLLAILDSRGVLVDLNQAWEQCLDYPPSALTGITLAELAHPADRALVTAELERLGTSERVAFEARFQGATGAERWLLWQISRDQRTLLCYAVGRDITGQKQAEAALHASEQRFHQLIDTAPDATFVVDVPSQQVIFFNREEFCGYPRSDLGAAGAASRAVHPEDRLTLAAHYKRIYSAPSDLPSFDTVEYRFRRLDGQLEWVQSRAVVLSRTANGSPQQIIFTLTLITERKRSEQLIDYQAHYDPVTGLPNRFLFSDRLEERIRQAALHNERFALCCIDLDRFNQINDSLGHVAGDDVLVQVADRLRSALRPGDSLARMGGDEFTVVLGAIPSAEEASRSVQALMSLLEQPFILAGHELFISASIGISLYPNDGTDPMTLLKHADNALYRAKAAGRNNVSWFVPELGRATLARLELGNQLRRAIDQHQFELHYQPLVSMSSGRVVGVEALLRWRHPERGLVAPGDFLAVAEERHLMTRISSWVLDEACRQTALWQQAGHPAIYVAVNISAPQFERDEIVPRVAQALHHANLAPNSLVLEITESVLMRDPEGSAARITHLRSMGVKVAIDDFGTGYSSLAYLQRFPVDALKIDRSFVWGLSEQHASNQGALIRAIVALAHSLGLSVVAEGVETPVQHGLLQALGCDVAQGFLYARGLPANELWEQIVSIHSRV